MKITLTVLLILLGFAIAHIVVAQDQHVVDSLESVVGLMEDSEDKVNVLIDLSDEFRNSDFKRALTYVDQSCELSEKISFHSGSVRSLIRKADLYAKLSDHGKALEFAIQTKEMSEDIGNKKIFALSYFVIGDIFNYLGDYNAGADYLFQSLKLYESTFDSVGMALALNGISIAHFKTGNIEKSTEYLLQSLNIAKEIKDIVGISRALNNIAANYQSQGKYKQAKQYLEESLEINKDLGFKDWIGINYMNLGSNSNNLGELELADKYYKLAIDLFNEIKSTKLLTTVYLSYSGYLYEINEIDSSLKYAQIAFDESFLKGINSDAYSSASLLRRAYQTKNDLKNALKYSILQNQYKDSLDIEQGAIKLSKLEIMHEFEKNEQIRKVEQQRKNFFIILIIVVLVFSLIVTIILIKRKSLKAKNALLEKKQLEIDLEVKNKELVSNMMYLSKKNEMLTDISESLLEVKKEAVKDETKAAINKIANKILKSSDDEIWEEFNLRFKMVHKDFYDILLGKYPDLSPSDLKLCAFLRLNMSTKEISELTGQSTSTLEIARYRLRKKLDITNKQVNLVTFLTQIDNSQ